jgi:AcrR family transcriptional regulator
MKKSLDPRIKKTRKYLREALLTLIKEKGFDAITVGDLTTVAEINRATFYQHYQDKFDLLNQTIDDMLFTLGSYVAPKNTDDFLNKDGIIPIHLRLFEFISENSSFFKIMMGENGIPSFQNRFIKMICHFMEEKLDQLQPDPQKMQIPKEIIIHYISFAIFGLLSYWLQNDMNYSVTYMAKQLSVLTDSGPFVASGLK